jgi:hypothetical protein
MPISRLRGSNPGRATSTGSRSIVAKLKRSINVLHKWTIPEAAPRGGTIFGGG